MQGGGLGSCCVEGVFETVFERLVQVEPENRDFFEKGHVGERLDRATDTVPEGLVAPLGTKCLQPLQRNRTRSTVASGPSARQSSSSSLGLQAREPAFRVGPPPPSRASTTAMRRGHESNSRAAFFQCRLDHQGVQGLVESRNVWSKCWVPSWPWAMETCTG